MGKHLNPLEKEFLIRQYKSNPTVKLRDFCESVCVSDTAFKKWLKQYDECGIEGLARADAEIKEILPEGVDRTEEAYKKEILKLRILSKIDIFEIILAVNGKGHGKHTDSQLLGMILCNTAVTVCDYGDFAQWSTSLENTGLRISRKLYNITHVKYQYSLRVPVYCSIKRTKQ